MTVNWQYAHCQQQCSLYCDRKQSREESLAAFASLIYKIIKKFVCILATSIIGVNCCAFDAESISDTSGKCSVALADNVLPLRRLDFRVPERHEGEILLFPLWLTAQKQFIAAYTRA